MAVMSFISAPDEQDEDDSFSGGLRDDFSNYASSVAPAPAPAAVAPTPGVAPVAPAALPPNANSADDNFARDYVVKPYTPPDRSGFDAATARVTADSMPTPHDKATNPKWWERLVGGLGAGMMAAGRAPGAMDAGSAVVNRRYNQAEQQRYGRLAGDKAQLNAEKDRIAATDHDWERQNQGLNTQINADRASSLNADRRAQERQRLQAIAPTSLQPDDPDNPLGTWHGVTVGGQKVTLNQPPDTWLKTPAGQQAIRAKYVKDNGLKGDDAKFYMAEGKLAPRFAPRAPREPSAELIEFGDWKSAFVRDNKRQPTAEEIHNFKRGSGNAGGKPVRGTPEQFKQLDAKTSEDYAESRQMYESETAAAKSGAGRAEADRAFRERNQQIGFNHSQQLRDLGGIPAEDNGPAASGAAPAAAPPSPAVPPVPRNGGAVAQPVVQPGNGQRLTDPNLARQYLQKAGGDKAKARQLAQQDNWNF